MPKYVEASSNKYTQYPIIRNGLIRNRAEFLGKFKKRALSGSNLRNASKNLRNGLWGWVGLRNMSTGKTRKFKKRSVLVVLHRFS